MIDFIEFSGVFFLQKIYIKTHYVLCVFEATETKFILVELNTKMTASNKSSQCYRRHKQINLHSPLKTLGRFAFTPQDSGQICIHPSRHWVDLQSLSRLWVDLHSPLELFVFHYQVKPIIRSTLRRWKFKPMSRTLP